MRKEYSEDVESADSFAEEHDASENREYRNRRDGHRAQCRRPREFYSVGFKQEVDERLAERENQKPWQVFLPDCLEFA